mmetsp:Transcript_37924/g.55908  ORF Transcript_37924/g.55908 Transcript_37924/m.55908 type:complete len:240 (-) Transcript_37924:963-1682(-)
MRIRLSCHPHRCHTWQNLPELSSAHGHCKCCEDHRRTATFDTPVLRTRPNTRRCLRPHCTSLCWSTRSQTHELCRQQLPRQTMRAFLEHKPFAGKIGRCNLRGIGTRKTSCSRRSRGHSKCLPSEELHKTPLACPNRSPLVGNGCPRAGSHWPCRCTHSRHGTLRCLLHHCWKSPRSSCSDLMIDRTGLSRCTRRTLWFRRDCLAFHRTNQRPRQFGQPSPRYLARCPPTDPPSRRSCA